MAEKKESSFDALPLPGKIFILILILGVVSAIFYFSAYMSLSDEVDAAKTQHAALQDQLREAEQREQEYLRLTEELASREEIDRANKRVLPTEAEIAAFLQNLNQTAELSGLEMKLVEPRPEESEELYIRIPVQLELRGRFHQLAKFFYNISRLERAISMENIVLTEPAASESNEVHLHVSVLATTFRRPSDSADPAANGGAG